MKEVKFTFKSKNADETIKFGERLGRLLAPGDVIAFIGDLGAGKTTLIKGIVLGLGVDNRRAVKSPTFSLVNIYKGRLPVYHFDAYRLESIQEMIDIGSDEMIFGKGVSLIEWADKVYSSLPKEYIKITLTAISENKRNIEVCGFGDYYCEMLYKNWNNLIVKEFSF
ncbi:MAG: tRNA (adenosine(37)-N6)-threonylcarbamoyltransferase complex ATPase subunit type 1 TsaE [Candidatus Loosdrechtia sp.]|uniref:tRNA (adenosine(37)-N6)-threonylcarbamoyltransferase complex ATPase subunit type 1 TsaE n=1 Tax=Candidatus Loosdrechtia sp. TaxID=3101272 RepID=UPI003A7174AA|nr:MAG: tRNA (adenosine(37)-N6)-threonylcarbamoyltransferase complex ATPase subunit type 1 TsaE [Candidatus Jettenia sp. AMX2]